MRAARLNAADKVVVVIQSGVLLRKRRHTEQNRDVQQEHHRYQTPDLHIISGLYQHDVIRLYLLTHINLNLSIMLDPSVCEQ